MDVLLRCIGKKSKSIAGMSKVIVWGGEEGFEYEISKVKMECN